MRFHEATLAGNEELRNRKSERLLEVTKAARIVLSLEKQSNDLNLN